MMSFEGRPHVEAFHAFLCQRYSGNGLELQCMMQKNDGVFHVRGCPLMVFVPTNIGNQVADSKE